MLGGSYSVQNDREFKAALTRAQKLVGDLSPALKIISDDFYKSQRAIFKLQSPGLYPDLKESTKRDKTRKGFSIYPILKRTGRLAESTLSASTPDSINIITKKTLTLGTKTPYGIFHQSDQPRSKIPLRKFLFIGPEAPRFALSEQQGRLERWVNTINNYVSAALGAKKRAGE